MNRSAQDGAGRGAGLPPAMLEPVKEVIRQLVEGRYEELAAASPFFEADELREWMGRWSMIPLATPPDRHYESGRVEAFPLDEPPPRWRVWVDLWDAEEDAVADLHAIVFVRETAAGEYRAELKEVLP